MRRLTIAAAAVLLCVPLGVHAQRGAAAPATARDGAALDLTGYWVSVIVEDWKWRMVTPNKGFFEAIPLNEEGRRVGLSWDPVKDEAAGEQCRSYGAANIMRMPGRLHITWQDSNTLRIDTDAGNQTRLFHFGSAAPLSLPKPTWQGVSQARWEYAPGRRSGPRLGSLKVVTTDLKSGYVRKNGAPYSAKATVTEYYDVNVWPNGEQWMTVTTKVEDPVYLTRPYLTSSDWKKLPDGSGFSPTPCAAK